MEKSYLITFEPDYTMTVQTELFRLTDKTNAPIVEVKRNGEKYYINKDRIMFFKEYNENTDAPKGKQF